MVVFVLTFARLDARNQMNIPAIVSSFRSVANINRDDEVSLFRKLATSIENNSNSVFIEETHGQVAQVEFNSRIQNRTQCEISDLLIVVRNIPTDEYRATFWQAKLEKNPRWPAPRGISNFDFNGQLNQWELLSHRPIINGVANFRPHPNLLKDASSPSIGSYGVFYEDHGIVEVNYSVAEMVCSSSVSIHPRMVINELIEPYYNWRGEVLVRSNLNSFLIAVDDFTVGALIETRSNSDLWLRSYINGKCKNNGAPDFIDPDNQSDKVDGEDDGLRLLLISVGGD